MNRASLRFLDERLAEEKEYWSQKLSGDLVAAGIPLDHSRPAAWRNKKAAIDISLDSDIKKDLQKVCRGNEALIFIILVAVLKIVLHKYTRIEDIIVGMAVERRYKELASLNNALALRDHVNGSLKVRDLIENIRRTISEAYANQKYSFKRLLEVLNVELPSNRAPLFNVVIVIDGMHNTDNIRDLKEDVTLRFSTGGGTLSGVIEFSQDLFKQETIEVFAEHYERVLRVVLKSPDLTISEIELLPSDQRNERIFGFNNTESDYPNDKTIYQLFQEQVARTPGEVAVAHGDSSLTYHELNSRANQLAHYLRGLGVARGSFVGLFMERSIDLIIGLLGILKAGGAYAPFDPAHPRERLAYMLKDARSSLVLTQQRLADRLPSQAGAAFCLDSDWNLVARESEQNPDDGAGADDLAYLIYTSGSTGSPKGVKIQHRSLVNYIWWAKDVYVRGDRVTFPFYSSLAFDLTVTSIFTPLITGNRIVICHWEGRDPRVDEIVKDEAIEIIKLTPSHLSLIKDKDNRMSRIKRLIVGGEALETGLARRVLESFAGNVEIFNEYGPTEATVGCTVHKFDPAKDDRSFVPIGRPAANVQIYVLDEDLQPVADNLIGDLYISGDGLAEGYLNLEGLTEERFIKNPFLSGRRMYKTGDIARWLPDKVLEYLGRTDDQVKFHGHRVEMNEIRCALNRHPQVRDSVILLKKDSYGHDVMVAYYVSRQELTAAHLRSFMAESIIEETIPNFFIRLPKLPLTLNGKINYAALPDLNTAISRTDREYVAASTAAEKLLAGIWSQILRAERVGIYDNFFDLGGHSLLAAQVMSRVKEAFHVELPLHTLFKSPTIAAFAKQLEAAMNAENRVIAPPITPGPRGNALPLTFAQQRLWFLDQLAPNSSSNNVPAAIRFKGRLDVAALEESLTEIIRRHESLRTRFVTLRGQPMQVIDVPARCSLPVEDLRDLPEAQREEEALRRAAEQAKQPFDLSGGNLLRTSLLRTGVEEHILLVTMHHIISDGWSVGVFIRELAALYDSFLKQRPAPLAEIPIQFGDYALWQREWLQGDTIERLTDYWTRQLEGAPQRLELPADRLRPEKQSYRGALYPVTLSEGLTETVRDLSRREDATLFMTLLAAFNVLLHHATKQEDIIVGTDVANRNHIETECLIGFLVNQIVLRTSLSGAPTFREILRRVREVTLGAYAHQDMPFDKLVETLKPERSLKHSPLFQVKLVLQNVPMPLLELTDISLTLMAINSGVAKLDLTLILREEAGGVEGWIEYNTDLFEEDTISRFAVLFETILQHVITRPQVLLSDLREILSNTERRILDEKEKKRATSDFERFKNIKPQIIKLPAEGVVQTGYLQPGLSSPLVLQPRDGRIDLVDWGKKNSEFIEHELRRHGALLFRNFDLGELSRFEQFAKNLCPGLFSENGEHSRETISGAIYTPVYYPAYLRLLWHNENSFNHQWPLKIWFCCAKPAKEGGATPIVDSRKMFESISPAIRERFIRKGVMYVRNYGDNFELDWQKIFRTSSKSEVERRCREDRVEFEWKDWDRLVTRSVRPAVCKHPYTGEMVWFNQAQLWHPRCLDVITRGSIRAMFKDEDLPRNCYYGDGSVIEDSAMDEILEIYQKLEVSFTWQTWDVLMLDNMLSAHGRAEFSGERKLLVAMGEMLSYSDI